MRMDPLSSSWLRIGIVYTKSRTELTSCSPSGSVLLLEGSPFPYSDLWLLVGKMLGNMCVCVYVRERERKIVTLREESPQIPQQEGLVRSQFSWVQAPGHHAPRQIPHSEAAGCVASRETEHPGPKLSLGTEFLFPKSRKDHMGTLSLFPKAQLIHYHSLR